MASNLVEPDWRSTTDRRAFQNAPAIGENTPRKHPAREVDRRVVVSIPYTSTTSGGTLVVEQIDAVGDFLTGDR